MNQIVKQLSLHHQSCSLDISQPEISVDEPHDFDLEEGKSIGTSTSEDADSYCLNLFEKVSANPLNNIPNSESSRRQNKKPVAKVLPRFKDSQFKLNN